MTPSGSTFPAAPIALAFSDPVTDFLSPFTIAVNACSATCAGSSFFEAPIRVSCAIPALRKKSVSVAPGMNDVIVTPVSRTSSPSASAKDCTNDFEAL
ncbi:hypothetical protein ADK41_27760 [Streptomyces caelestis]|uniref:Uncharacterized protein n=1 Tax=Streptomyces caelestis TaxID=36816 RepID=A0A0N0S5A0_9ACTN|nr:hypothetical protein ADK41_27760 [Streptomyces caelestis]